MRHKSFAPAVMQAQGQSAPPAQPAQPAQPVTPQEAQQMARQAAEYARALQDELAKGGPVVVGPGAFGRNSPAAVYEAMVQQREELENQLDRLENQREEIADELRAPNQTDATRKGLESRLANIDARITAVESQLAQADAAVARAAAIPGAVQPDPPPEPRQGPPEEVFVLGAIFMFVVLLPLTIAYARRIWRRSAAVVASIPQEIYDRFNRLDQAVDSIAIEVERIGEGQRFLTRLHSDRGLTAGPAERIEMPEREVQRQKLK